MAAAAAGAAAVSYPETVNAAVSKALQQPSVFGGFIGGGRAAGAGAAAVGAATAAGNALTTATSTLANAVKNPPFSLTGIKDWWVSSFAMAQSFSQSQLFAALLIWVVMAIMLVTMQPPFVERDIPNKHPLEDAPVSARLVLIYSTLPVILYLCWPTLTRWAPSVFAVAKKYV